MVLCLIVGHFFSKIKKERAAKPRPAIEGRPSNPRRTAISLNRLGCQGCPLNTAPVKTPKMAPTLARVTLIYFLNEAPEKHEDERTHSPLTGPAGNMLRSCLPDDLADYASFDNCVRDRPEGDRTPTWQEIECCRPLVTQSIEKTRPRLIVGLGVVPLSWMLGLTDLRPVRGRFFAVRVGSHSCWFLPTYHPSFVTRNAYNKKNALQSRYGHCFRMDIERAIEAATN